jgi:predicted amidohydrolase
MGSQILLSPCAWAVDGGHDNQKQPYGDLWKRSYTTLARLYDMPVVGVSSVGRIDAGAWKGRKCIGCSLAVGSGGEILAQGPYGENAESLIVVEVQMSHRSAKGTAIAELLRSKGYTGP